MTRHVRTHTAFGLAALACFVAGCSSSKATAPAAVTTSPAAAATTAALATTVSNTSSPTTASAAGGVTTVVAASTGADVAIVDLSFQPATLTVKPGTTVRFTNNDGFGHTVTATDKSYTSGTIAAGASFTHQFSTAGTYAYACTIHSRMAGTIVVAP